MRSRKLPTFASLNRKQAFIMPINKDALKRYQIIDEMLADPNRDYTTSEIHRRVVNQGLKVSLRMIQKDILSIEEEFGKKMVRNPGRYGSVKYEDQSNPIFSKELTENEEEMLCETLKTLGQFEGLPNFQWLNLLKKKLELDTTDKSRSPIISFSRNDVLQISTTLLGRLFTAISMKKTIQFTYTRFDMESMECTVYPYQLRQYNDRWFLLGTPVGTDEDPYDGQHIVNYALDRMSEEFKCLDNTPYIDTPVDIDRRFDEIIGVTLLEDQDVESIYFAVRPESVDYVRTKYMHLTQIEFIGEDADVFRQKYPSLNDCTFFSIECRPNYELYSRFASYGANVILLEPSNMAQKMKEMMCEAAENYKALQL